MKYHVDLWIQRGEPSPVEWGEFYRRPENQPYYPPLRETDYQNVGLYHCWFLKPEIHDSLQGKYRFSYIDPVWCFEFDHVDDALIFKLMWGGRQPPRSFTPLL